MKTVELVNKLIYQHKTYLVVVSLGLTVSQQQEGCGFLKDL